MRTLIAVFIVASTLGAQIPVPIIFAGGGFPPLALGAHAATDNNTTSSATVVVTLTPQKAGSTIACAFKHTAAANFTSIADNVNSGKYLPGASGLREPNHNYAGGIYYHENVAASATTITLTYSLAGTHGQMACIEIQNTPASYGFDSSFVASQATTSTNPVTGTTLTPFLNGEFLYNELLFSAGTTTAGTNFTLLDQGGAVASTALYPEYWLQTTATASNGPYTNNTNGAYSDVMMAFAPQQAGTCGVSMVLDFSGGTNGNTPVLATDLTASTHGNAPQPNADRCVGCNNGGKPGVWGGGVTGFTYSSTANQPLATARNCPFYKVPGTTAVGLSEASGNAAGGPTVQFDTSGTVVTAFACIMTDTPISHVGTFDHFEIGVNDNSDYIVVQVNSNGGAGTFATETKGGTVNTPTINWQPNTWYGVRLTEEVSGTDKAEYYSYSGSGCSGTPTLMGTHSHASSGTLVANTLAPLGTSVSNTYAAGTHFYTAGVLVDYLYGSAIVW